MSCAIPRRCASSRPASIRRSSPSGSVTSTSTRPRSTCTRTLPQGASDREDGPARREARALSALRHAPCLPRRTLIMPTSRSRPICRRRRRPVRHNPGGRHIGPGSAARPRRGAALDRLEAPWASLMTSRTPARPRARSERRKAVQNAPSSSPTAARPSTSRSPVAPPRSPRAPPCDDPARLVGLDVVGSDRGAVATFRPLRLPGPPSEPDVRVATHPALHDLTPWRAPLIRSVARPTARGCSCPDSGSG